MKVHIKTYGCSLNHADSEAMAGVLQKQGHELVDEDQADVVLYNTCTVKNPTQDSFLATLKKQEKPVVIAGCMPQADKQGMFENYVTLGTAQLGNVDQAIIAAKTKQKLHLIGNRNEQPLDLPSIRSNPHVEIVPICAGCLSNCTYCKTKQARGNLRSYRPMDIEKKCKQAIQDGVKEIWLTSQDNGAYGMDIKSNPGELLKRIASLDGDFKIRFGMTNPDWTKKWLKELIEAFKMPKVYKFLHLPIQSGSDQVLKHMRRRCTADDIRTIVNAFRKEIPNITIATDVICGYPTETEKDFQETIVLVEELKFPVINISKFYSRPDTPAATLKPLPSEIIKDRSRQLTKLFESNLFASQHSRLQGQVVRALFARKQGQSNIGKTENYTQVIVNTEEDFSGTYQNVLIKQTTRDDLRGYVVRS